MKKYEQISNQIIERIHNNQYAPGSFLPSERSLMLEFHVTRDTIRNALKSLTAKGYIEKIPHKGSKILAHEKVDFFISELSGATEKRHSYNYEFQTEILSLEKIYVDEGLREKSGFSLGEPVWYLIRRRFLNGKAIILEFDYLRASIIPNLTQEIVSHSLYRFLESDLHLKLKFSKKEISVEDIISPITQYLHLSKQDKNMIVVRNWAYLDDYTHFQYNESWHQVDSFKFVLLADRPFTE